ncbi:g3478 [Coccomyxa elongata]
MRPDSYSMNFSEGHDLGPYSRAPTPQSEASSTSRFGSSVDRRPTSSHSTQSQPRHAHSRSASPTVSNGGAAGIRALPSFRARGQVQDLAMAAAGSRLRGRSSLDSRSSLDNPARTPTSAVQTSSSPIDVTPLGLSQSAPWPEVPLSPKTPQTPMLSEHGNWYSLDMRASRSLSIPEDESIHSEGSRSASFRTPVLPKGVAPFYMDSAARESGDLEAALPTSSGCCWCCCGPRSVLQRCSISVWHYCSLVFAEHPLRRHRSWMGAVVPCPADHGDADRDAISGDGAADGRCGPTKRRLPFGASEPGSKKQGLDEFYANNHKRRRLAYALRRRKSGGGFKGAWDSISNDLFILGELMFDRTTPSSLRHHTPWFTAVFLAIQFITFAFMAGEYVSYLTARPAAGGCGADVFKSGPHALWQWVVAWDPCHTFQPDFLALWGAKYAPVMRPAAVWWRWLSSLVAQDSFVHLAANALLFGGLGLHLECRYGTARIVLLALICGLAGNFLDSAVMDPCTVVLAGAGCTMGLLGPFVMDVLLNFDAIRYPVLRLVGVAGAATCFATAAVLTGYPYRLTPLGGFLAGIFPGMVYLPHVKSEKYEWYLPFCALGSSFLLLIVLPIIIYSVRFPIMACL